LGPHPATLLVHFGPELNVSQTCPARSTAGVSRLSPCLMLIRASVRKRCPLLRENCSRRVVRPQAQAGHSEMNDRARAVCLAGRIVLWIGLGPVPAVPQPAAPRRVTAISALRRTRRTATRTLRRHRPDVTLLQMAKQPARNPVHPADALGEWDGRSFPRLHSSEGR
jgi:hypothetical protein